MNKNFPTTLPTSEEITACREYEPEFISAKWHNMKPSVLRVLIYRSIGGDAILTPAIDDRNISHELLVIAELEPPVWGVTRDLADQNWLHLYGVCLGCNREVEYSSGQIYPFQWLCIDCVNNSKRNTADRPFWYTIDSWPTTYQHECVDYLLESREPL